MKKATHILLLFIFVITGFVSCASTKSTENQNTVIMKKKNRLDSCLVDKEYDFVFEIINNTNETIFVSNGVKQKTARDNSIIETKTFPVMSGESFNLKYNCKLIEKLFENGCKIQNLKLYVFMASKNNTLITGNEKSICIYEKDGRYVVDRYFYSDHREPQKILAENKYVLTLSNEGNDINASCQIKDLSDFEYDAIIPGNGKSPVKLQLRNSKEYIEVDWQYCNYHKENRAFGSDGAIGTSMDGRDWQICNTGKDIQLILNYNRNNDYYDISSANFEWDESHSNKIRKNYMEIFRPYTVEELELLIGVKPQRTSPDGVPAVK